MLFLLYGTEKFLIQKEIARIIDEKKVDEFNVSHFNAREDSLDTILLDASSMPLFGRRRAIIIDEAYYFSSEKVPEEFSKKLEFYINNYNENNITIFVLNNEKLDERRKITKLIKTRGQILTFNSKKDVKEYLKANFKGFQISDKALDLIKEKLDNRVELVDQEMEKLALYKEDKKISEVDIYECISEYPHIDFFAFIETIIKKDVNLSLKIYEELLKMKEEPIKIIVTLANQFRLMYQAKKLKQSGYQESEIASELGEHPYRVKLAIMAALKYSDNDLLANLKRLGEINLETKKGLLDSKSALELFIMGM